MNIWYLSAYDQPNGLSSRTYDFSRELVSRGHLVTIFTNSYCHWTHVERLKANEKWRIEETDGIRVVWLKTIHYTGNGWRRGANMLSNVWRSIQVVRTLSDKPDVVIGPSVPLGTGWAASEIATMKGAAFVFEVRDVWPQALVDLGHISRMSPFYVILRTLERYLYHRADRISAVLPLTKRHVALSGGDVSKVRWIPNGLRMERFQSVPEYVGGREGSLTLMYIGGFSATHDVITILGAADKLKDIPGRTCFFILVGGGSEKDKCRAKARMLGLKNVEFRDPIPKGAVPALLAQADVLIASVKDTPVYQFGINSNKIFDYLAAGRPIIFACKAPNDPVKESGAGISIPPQDPGKMAEAIRTLLSMSRKERSALGANGRRYARERLDVRILAREFEKLLSEASTDAEQGRGF